jgi:hypothetical protein
MPRLSDRNSGRLDALVAWGAVLALAWAFGLWRWHSDPNYCQEGPHWAYSTTYILHTDTIFVKLPTFTHTCAANQSYPKKDYKRL